jgi:nucleotide-binding universal stress UspA family protein
MSKVILVPLDGSPLAERAVPYAARFAVESDARLCLVRAAIGHFSPSEDPAEVQIRAVEDAEGYLEAVAARIADERGIVAETAVPYGRPAPAILDEIKIRQANLVVMATHGRGGIGRFVYGSVADEVLRRADVPVLLIPATCERSWPPGRPLRILVPLDRSELSEVALAPAGELARRLGAELILVHVVYYPTYAYSEGYAYLTYDLDTELADATAELEAFADQLRATGTAVRTKAVAGFPIAKIAEIAHGEGVDLVAMATHGRGGLARLVLGSVATGTLQRAGLPVYLVRPAELGRPTVQPVVEPAPALAEPAPDLVEAAPPWLGPSVTITLDPSEVDLIQRGLSDRLFLAEGDSPLARPARELLTRLRDAEVETRAAQGPAATGSG